LGTLQIMKVRLWNTKEKKQIKATPIKEEWPYSSCVAPIDRRITGRYARRNVYSRCVPAALRDGVRKLGRFGGRNGTVVST
jgi:hypothetical protein